MRPQAKDGRSPCVVRPAVVGLTTHGERVSRHRPASRSTRDTRIPLSPGTSRYPGQRLRATDELTTGKHKYEQTRCPPRAVSRKPGSSPPSARACSGRVTTISFGLKILNSFLPNDPWRLRSGLDDDLDGGRDAAAAPRNASVASSTGYRWVMTAGVVPFPLPSGAQDLWHGRQSLLARRSYRESCDPGAHDVSGRTRRET